jgi:hypothetical protein
LKLRSAHISVFLFIRALMSSIGIAIAITLLAGLIGISSVSFSQTVTAGTLHITGTFVNYTNISVNNHIVNETTGPVSILPGSTTSRVTLAGNTVGSGHTIYGGGSISFYRLDLRGARETRLKVNVRVTNMLRIGFAPNAFTAADSGFTVENNTLTIDSAATYLSSSTAKLTFAGGTVIYDNTNPGSQTIIDHKAIYGTLNLSSGNTNYIIPSVADASFEAATLNHSTGTGSVTINDSLKVTGSAAFGTIADIASGKVLELTSTTAASTIDGLTTLTGTMQKAGTQKLVITTVTNTTASGIIENIGTDSLAIRTLSGNAGTIRNTSTGYLAFNSPATSTGTISNTSTGSLTFDNTITNNTPGTISNTSTGTVTFANNLTGTGAVSQTNGGTMNVGGSFTQNTYTLNGTNGTVLYNSAAAQNVIGTPYYNLTITGTADTSTHKTATGIFSVGGNLTIAANSNLDMSSYSISSLGGGTNSGKIMWQLGNAYVGGSGMTEFYGPNAGNVAAGANYGDMLFTGAGMMTFATAGTTTATGDVTVNTNAKITVDNGVTLQVNGSTYAIGDITNNGIVNVGP